MGPGFLCRLSVAVSCSLLFAVTLLRALELQPSVRTGSLPGFLNGETFLEFLSVAAGPLSTEAFSCIRKFYS